MTLEEKSLIEKAKLGDESALNLLIKNHAPVVFNTALRILQNESEAEDVLQETFIIFIEKIGSFEGRSSLSTWLYRVATNVAIGKIRAKKKEGSIVELDVLDHEPLTGHELRSWPEEIEKMWKDESIQSCLTEALKELPVIFRTVFILRDLEGHSVEETSKSLDISPSNVKVRLMRARLFLRDKMAHNLHCVEAIS